MDPFQRYATDPDVWQNKPLAPRSLKELGYGDQVVVEIEKLFSVYGSPVMFGVRHSAACGAWRSERIQLADESLSRFANRVHVFERGFDNTPGRYLGFVSLRPVAPHRRWPYHHVVVYATVPRRFLRPRYHVVNCNAGAADGVLPFRCVPYCMPYGDVNRAACLHAAVHEALLLKMTSYGCTPISSQDMLALLWERSGQATLQQLRQTGATLQDAEYVLRHEQARAGAIRETFLRGMSADRDEAEAGRAKALRTAQRSLTDYLANGMPVIMAVQPPPGNSDGHSVLVIGMHLLQDPDEPAVGVSPGSEGPTGFVEQAELPGRFLYHDLMQGPYREDPAARLLDSAWVEEDDAALSGINFLVVGPRGTRLGIEAVRARTLVEVARRPEDLWADYCARFGLPASDGARAIPRMVTRLLGTSQVVHRYLSRYEQGVFAACRVELDRLRRAHEALETASRPLGDETAAEPPSAFAEQQWWAVEVRLPTRHEAKTGAGRRLPPALVCLWRIQDAEAGNRAPQPLATIRYLSDTCAELATREGTREYECHSDSGSAGGQPDQLVV